MNSIDVGAVLAGVAAGVTVLAPLVGFAMRIERRMTRLESAIRHHLHVDIDISGRVPL